MRFEKYSFRTVLGASLTVVAPTGQYFYDRLIKIGTNRWSFKPELGVSYKLTEEWLIDLYAAVWLFTDNDSFYPGTSVRHQDPSTAFQTHVRHNLSPVMWAAIDLTYYSEVNLPLIISTMMTDRATRELGQRLASRCANRIQ